MNEWYSASELEGLALPGIPANRQHIGRKAQAEGWNSRLRQGKGGGFEYHVSSLPEAARTALLQRDLQQNEAAQAGALAAREIVLAEDIEDRTDDAARQAGLAEYQTLPAEVRQIVDARLAVLARWRDFQQHQTAGLVQLRARFVRLFGQKALGLGTAVYDLAVTRARKTLSVSTLNRWEDDLKKGGPAALAPAYGKRSSRDYERRIEDDEHVAALVLAMIKTYGPHVNAENVRSQLEARLGPDAPALRTVQRFLARWREEHRQAASYLDSPEAWRGRHMVAFGKVDADVVCLNQVWEMDSTLGDVALVERLADGTTKERRYAILSVVDVYSRRVRLLVCRTSRSVAIALLMRKAMLAWGIPELIRMDNGKDYSSKRIEMLTAALDVRIHRCRPFQPQEKPFVERLFRTLQGGKLALLPGFVGHDVAQRQKLRSREQARVRGGEAPFDLGTIGVGPIEFQAWLDEWAENQYEREKHRTLGCSPFERVQAYRGRVRKILDERALDCLLDPAPDNGRGEGVRVVQKEGVQVAGRTYIAAELGAFSGEEVVVCFDPYQAGRVCVYGGVDMRFIVWAVDPETNEERRQIAVRSKKVQRLLLQEEMQALKRAAKGSGVESAWMEIAVSRSLDAAKLQLMPKAADAHETPALSGALDAANAREALGAAPDLARETTPETKAQIRQLRAEEERRTEGLHAYGMPADGRFDNADQRYQTLRRAFLDARPDLLTDEHRAFIERYEERMGYLPHERLFSGVRSVAR